MSENAASPTKKMRLRYAGQCRICATDIPVGEMAVYERETKTVTCVECVADLPHTATETAITSPIDPKAESVEVFTGTAGASANREYERRKDKRETRIRDEHPHLGKLILALSEDPQSTRSWATGARGEEVLGQRLDTLSGRGVLVLHDRRIPRSKANIDHIAVSAAGVFVIDAKKYQGRPTLRVEGGLFRPRTETLLVGSRDCTKLVDGVQNQVALVRSALLEAGLEGIPVHGALCFVDAEWPIFGGDFSIAGIQVLWPKKAAQNLMQPGLVDDQTTNLIHRTLASAFPPA